MEGLQEIGIHRQPHIHTGYIVLGIRDSLFYSKVQLHDPQLYNLVAFVI